MNDLISRQAAIDAIVQCTNCGDEDTLREYVLKHSLDNGWTGGILEALDAVKDLPPVQSEPQWIPVSERLPEEYGEYLVTKRIIGWNCEEYDVNDIAYFDDDGFPKADRVIAWMPLPEAYKQNK